MRARGARRHVLAKRHREKTFARFLVDIFNKRQPSLYSRLLDRRYKSRPFAPRQTADGISPARGLALVAIEIVFQFAVIGQEVCPAPALGAGSGPRLEIGRNAAQRPEAHDA